ncbi:hypothetical protein FB567DRAFT_546716 [Paraphoma chrysanthemicola]|uniref:Uncharacterized protein n=1 Tax=Paraphoma chrysanthemicola TaxID=798071 RepID=A0A8K0RB88_9PLEO|nr:hypothetical protein FB567DRAFT_546716 [Paraphoma chrysanthemicola]
MITPRQKDLYCILPPNLRAVSSCVSRRKAESLCSSACHSSPSLASPLPSSLASLPLPRLTTQQSPNHAIPNSYFHAFYLTNPSPFPSPSPSACPPVIRHPRARSLAPNRHCTISNRPLSTSGVFNSGTLVTAPTLAFAAPIRPVRYGLESGLRSCARSQNANEICKGGGDWLVVMVGGFCFGSGWAVWNGKGKVGWRGDGGFGKVH